MQTGTMAWTQWRTFTNFLHPLQTSESPLIWSLGIPCPSVFQEAFLDATEGGSEEVMLCRSKCLPPAEFSSGT